LKGEATRASIINFFTFNRPDNNTLLQSYKQATI